MNYRVEYVYIWVCVSFLSTEALQFADIHSKRRTEIPFSMSNIMVGDELDT